LINYKGKLCEIYVEYARDVGFPLKLIMRVLEDVDKQEWSKDVYSLYSERKFGHDLSAIGNIVLSMGYTYNSLYWKVKLFKVLKSKVLEVIVFAPF